MNFCCEDHASLSCFAIFTEQWSMWATLRPVMSRRVVHLGMRVCSSWPSEFSKSILSAAQLEGALPPLQHLLNQQFH